MICGPTMHAAMISDASLPACFVTAPAAIGSIAALAKWNRAAQPAKAINLRSFRNSHERWPGLAAVCADVARTDRSDAESALRSVSSTSSAGIPSAAAKRKTARSVR